MLPSLRPRLSSAPRRKGGAPRSIRGTWGIPSRWQAFCLAKQASIGYTARSTGRRELCHSFAPADSADSRAGDAAEMIKSLFF
jgi:hypothetical protein